jgi:hypothetical protein
MRISVIFVSRGRPEQLRLAVNVMQTLESGENEVAYYLGCDNDDQATIDVGNFIKPVQKLIGERPKRGISEIQNRIVKQIDGDVKGRGVKASDVKKSDAYVFFPDDGIVLTQNWDKPIEVALVKSMIVGWNDVLTLGELTYPVISKRWVDLVDNVFVEMFPYWFADTWLHEVYRFVTNSEVPIIQNLMVGGRRGELRTQGMRDLDWWWGFFNATRKIRILQAYNVRLNMGDGSLDYDDFVDSRHVLIEKGELRDRRFRPMIPTLEKKLAVDVDGEPSAKYVALKAEAEKYLADHNLKVWNE